MSIFTFILGAFIGVLLMAMVKAGSMAEKQSLVNESRSRLEETEDMVEDLTERNKYLTQNNRDKQNQIEELQQTIKDIEQLATSNTYNNEKTILGKIKELVSDYQSQN